MHILIIAGEELNESDLFHSIFELNQASALQRAGNQVGLVSFKMIGSLYTLLKKSFASLKEFNKLIGRLRQKSFFGFDFVNEYLIYGLPVFEGNGYYLYPSKIRSYRTDNTRCGVLAVKQYIRKNGRPDIIHAHSRFLSASLIAEYIKKRYNIPYVITEHSTFFARNLIGSGEIELVGKTINNSAAWIVVSPQLGRLIESKVQGLNKEWTFIPNMLDDIFDRITVSKNTLNSKKFSFINIAALEEKKGQGILLNAFAMAFAGKKEIALRIVGSGNLLSQLKKQSEALGISDQVTFLGQLSREAVMEELISSQVFVLPSFFETFGVVIIEALACGKPVIATRCGGPESIVDHSNGMLTEPGDPEKLCECMKSMMLSFEKYNASSIRINCLNKYGGKVISNALIDQYAKAIHLN